MSTVNVSGSTFSMDDQTPCLFQNQDKQHKLLASIVRDTYQTCKYNLFAGGGITADVAQIAKTVPLLIISPMHTHWNLHYRGIHCPLLQYHTGTWS